MPTMQAKKPTGNAQQQVRPRSFLVGTQEVVEGGDYDFTQVIDTSQHTMPPWALQSTGWLRGLWLLCTATGITARTATADAPFPCLASLQLDVLHNEPIFGPIHRPTA